MKTTSMKDVHRGMYIRRTGLNLEKTYMNVVNKIIELNVGLHVGWIYL